MKCRQRRSRRPAGAKRVLTHSKDASYHPRVQSGSSYQVRMFGKENPRRNRGAHIQDL